MPIKIIKTMGDKFIFTTLKMYLDKVKNRIELNHAHHSKENRGYDQTYLRPNYD